MEEIYTKIEQECGRLGGVVHGHVEQIYDFMFPKTAPPPGIPAVAKTPNIAHSTQESKTSFPSSLLVGGIIGVTVIGGVLLYPYIRPGIDRPVVSEGSSLEAVLILGADKNSAGFHLVQEFSKKGFVVFGTVSDVSQAENLEKINKQSVKALVLDPSDTNTVAPFLRSLNTALSLRFPLNSPGDLFNPQALSLSIVINTLALFQPTLAPVEHLPIPLVTAYSNRLTVLTLLFPGLLPLLRNSIVAHKHQVESTFLTIVPAQQAHQNLTLPFTSLATSFTQSTITLITSLRRELSITKSNISVKLIELGHVDGSEPPTSVTLPPRLNAMYSASLTRRLYISGSGAHASSGSPSRRSRRSPLKQIAPRIVSVALSTTSTSLLKPSDSTPIQIGSSSTALSMISTFSFLPTPLTYILPFFPTITGLVDSFLYIHDWLVRFGLEYHLSTTHQRNQRPRALGGTSVMDSVNSVRSGRPIPPSYPSTQTHRNISTAPRKGFTQASLSSSATSDESGGSNGVQSFDGDEREDVNPDDDQLGSFVQVEK